MRRLSLLVPQEMLRQSGYEVHCQKHTERMFSTTLYLLPLTTLSSRKKTPSTIGFLIGSSLSQTSAQTGAVIVVPCFRWVGRTPGNAVNATLPVSPPAYPCPLPFLTSLGRSRQLYPLGTRFLRHVERTNPTDHPSQAGDSSRRSWLQTPKKGPNPSSIFAHSGSSSSYSTCRRAR